MPIPPIFIIYAHDFIADRLNRGCRIDARMRRLPVHWRPTLHYFGQFCKNIPACKGWALGGKRVGAKPRSLDRDIRRQPDYRSVPTHQIYIGTPFDNAAAAGKDNVLLLIAVACRDHGQNTALDRKSTRLNSSHL